MTLDKKVELCKLRPGRFNIESSSILLLYLSGIFFKRIRAAIIHVWGVVVRNVQ